MIDITVDLETTTNGPDGSPEAHWPDNRVLLWGWKTGAGPIEVSDKPDLLMEEIETRLDDGEMVRFVGHNLKFDLKYMIRERPDIKWHMCEYACTMHRHYRMTGHKDKFISLEKLAAHHGLTFSKTLDLGAILKSGVKMEDIPRSDLQPYLEEDVWITDQINFIQDQEIDWTLNSPILPLAHMELLGLILDRPHAKAIMSSLVRTEKSLSTGMEKKLADHLEWDDGSPLLPGEVKFNAPRTISYLLTGKPVSGIKNGKRTLQWQTGSSPALPASDWAKFWPGKTPTNLGFPMPAAKLEQVQAALPHYKYIDWVLKYRKVQKLMNTYVGPFLEKTKTIPTVHPKMNVCATATGRLSSSDPNGQNLPPAARHLFKSEFGQFHEIDFKQLEVVCLAAITGDPQLIADIKMGVDVHFKTGQKVMGWKVESDMTKEERTLVKNVNFGLIYGGGASGLSMQTGQPKKLIKQLIDAFYARYPGVADWQHKFYLEVTRNLKPYDVKDGEQRYHSYAELPISKRKFHFVESESPKWLKVKTGRKFSFKPTETKNYPVQGFAGGDIVMMALVFLHHRLWDIPNTEIRMTVHDSLLVDTDMSVGDLRHEMMQVCHEIESVFGLPFNLAFDIESDTHWR